MTSGYVSQLEWVREQRSDRNPARVAWDGHWCRWWRLFTARGYSPNGAVRAAYRMTRDQLGKRPGPYPDGSDAHTDEA